MFKIKMTHGSAQLTYAFVPDKSRREITLIKIGITSQDLLKKVKTEKAHAYDSLAGELWMLHKCNMKIVPYVII